MLCVLSAICEPVTGTCRMKGSMRLIFTAIPAGQGMPMLVQRLPRTYAAAGSRAPSSAIATAVPSDLMSKGLRRIAGLPASRSTAAMSA